MKRSKIYGEYGSIWIDELFEYADGKPMRSLVLHTFPVQEVTLFALILLRRHRK